MTPDYRAHDAVLDARPDGSLLMRNNAALGPVAARTTDWLEHWADKTPDTVFLAERSGAGWREVSYATMRDQARALAGGLLAAGLSADTPILILSGNSVDHGILALAAQYVGVPIVPLAEQYALIAEARGQIDFVAGVIRPGMVYAEDGAALADVLGRDVFDGVLKVASHDAGPGVRLLADMTAQGGDIRAAEGSVTPDTVAKILMTSGSTSAPKGVPTTHRMMCANQAQIAHSLPFLKARPPLIVDWLPWNHCFGGSYTFNLMLANGGALYIDGGKPAPHLIGKTLENLALKPGTMTFNVPAGFAMIRDALRSDNALRQTYFEGLDMLFYAGASLPQDVWTDLEDMARDVRGDVPLFTSSWGLTETAPGVLLQTEPGARSGVIGVPMPGCDLKLIPVGEGRYEARVRGPNVFTGYVDLPEKTAEAFDDEGFYRTGDVMRFVDRDAPNTGMMFDGRLAEEFKLATGIWVQAAEIRMQVLGALRGLAADVVVTGADRGDIGLLVIPTQAMRAMSDARDVDGALIVPSMSQDVTDRLAQIGGSRASRIARALILSEPPSMGHGELTAKGSLNFHKLLTRRADLLARLYDDADPATLIIHKGASS